MSSTPRLYSLEYLERFKDNVFVYERYSSTSSLDDKEYTYNCILEKIQEICQKFVQWNVPEYSGFAIDIDEHSIDTLVLLLSILNHKCCYFYPFDGTNVKDMERNWHLTGISYILSKSLDYQKNLSSNEVQMESNNDCKSGHETILQLFHNKFYMIKISKDEDQGGNVFNCQQEHYWCYVMNTSGTTQSNSKMVFVPYQCIAPNILSLSNLLQLKEDDVIYLSSPATFDPFIVEFWLALQNGASLLITRRRSQIFQLEMLAFTKTVSLGMAGIQRKGVTIMQMTPSIFRLFGIQNIQSKIFHPNTTLRCLLLGGEIFPSRKEISTWLTGNNGNMTRIFNIYGITEISCWCLCEEYLKNALDSELNFMKYSMETPLGKCLDDEIVLRINRKLMDDETSPSSSSSSSSQSIGIEYGVLEMGSRTRITYIPEIDTNLNVVESQCRMCTSSPATEIVYRSTGDLVQRLENGQIYFCGRNNNVVKRFGKRICLDSLDSKIEKILKMKFPTIRGICLWFEDMKKLILCIIKEEEEDYDDNEENLVSLLKSHLDNHEQPDIIQCMREFPLSQHGKVDRKELKSLLMKSIKSTPTKTPLNIFKDFLKNTLGLRKELNIYNLEKDTSNPKRPRITKLNGNFRYYGGTSFHALSLSTEIGALCSNPNDQRKILEMLLDDEGLISLDDIIEFLSTIESNPKIVEVNPLLSPRPFHIKQLWRYNLEKCIDSSPSLLETDDVIAVGSHSQLVLIANASTGQLIAKLKLPDRVECPVVFLKEYPLAAVGCYNGHLYVFNWSTGHIEWSINVGGMIKAKPLLFYEEDLMVVASYALEYNLSAICIKEKNIKWQLKLGRKGIFSSPLRITIDQMFVATLDGSCALINITDDDSINWLNHLENPVFSTSFYAEQFTCIIVADVGGGISVLSRENGKCLTSYQASGNVFSGINVYEPMETDPTNHYKSLFLIFGCYDNNVYILKLTSMDEHFSIQLEWKIETNAPVFTTPQLLKYSIFEGKSVLLICSTNGQIIIYSLDNNRSILATYKLDTEIFSTPVSLHSTTSPTSEDEMFFLGTRDNHLYAFCIEKKL